MIRINLKSGGVILFDKEKPILLDLILKNYFVFNNFDECLLDLSRFYNKVSYTNIKHSMYNGNVVVGDEYFFDFLNAFGDDVASYNHKGFSLNINHGKCHDFFDSKYDLNIFEILSKYYLENYLRLKCTRVYCTIWDS